jgi:hypothetical protein
MPRASVRPAPVAALLAVVLAIVAAVGPAALPSVPLPTALVPAIARAADQLDIQAAARYVVDPAGHRIRASVDITAVNQQPNVQSGGTVTRYFYDGVNLGVQAEATHLRATQDGAPISVKVAKRTGYRLVTLRFRSNIYFQQTAHVRLTFDLPAGAPRSASDVRVGSAFATFIAWAFGDRGTVRVDVPSDFQVDLTGDTMTSAPGPAGYQSYIATATTPLDWYAWINATNDAALTHDTLTLADGEQVVIQAWPEDTRWLGRVSGLLTKGVPDLVDLIGLDWPVKGPLTVTEVHTPLLEGYAGFYDAQTDRITISEDLDDLTIVHEASHAWFNKSLYTERWITEGLADEYASRVLVALGRKRQAPDPVKRSDTAAFALEHWPPPAPIRDTQRSAEEQYGYDAAWTAMRTIVGAVGEDGMRRLFAATAGRTTAYPGEGSPEQTRLPNDWRRFLDLAEEMTPASGPKVEQAIQQWALQPADVKLLAPRTAARAAYATLVTSGGTWAPPDAVRTAMDAWSFATATSAMQAATDVLQERNEVASLAAAQGLVPPADTEAGYQDADNVAELTTLSDDLRTSADALDHLGTASHAVAAPRDFLTQLGLDGHDPAATLEAARSAWQQGDAASATAGADAAVALLAAAPAAGRARATTIGVGAGFAFVVLLVITLFVVARRRRRPRPVPAAAMAAAPPMEPWATRAPLEPSAPAPTSGSQPGEASQTPPAWPRPYATLPPHGAPSGPPPPPSPRDEGAPRP